MGAVLSIRRSIACLKSYGICVVVPHGLFVVSDSEAKQLHMYSLLDGTRIRSIGSKGDGKGQFDFRNGGLCVSPDGDSVLVADTRNNRVQEVRLVDGSWVRFVGKGVLKWPECVDCNADVIVVSAWACHRISVLSWADGSVRAQFGSEGSGPGHLRYPRGVRLLADGSGVVVADYGNHWLCVFAVSGKFVAAVGREQGLYCPVDVLECASDSSFIVANFHGDNFIKVSRDGVHFDVYCKQGSGDGEFTHPAALAALPNDGCLVVDSGNRRVQYLARLHARLAWMRACASRIV
jgi:DNA-binding beta-propeller fold protein YncE